MSIGTVDTVTPLGVPREVMPEPAITLYRLQACPYCERVVRTLDRLGLAYQSRYVEPMHSERNVVKRISGKRSVPAIVDRETGVTMSESANIVEYLERTYEDAVHVTDGGPIAYTDDSDATEGQ